MTAGRAVLAVASLLVVALAAVLVRLQSEQADLVATIVAALAGVAAVGVSVWAALPGRSRGSVRVRKTGTAVAGRGGTANAGVTGPAAAIGRADVSGTGRAQTGDDGEANSGVRLT